MSFVLFFLKVFRSLACFLTSVATAACWILDKKKKKKLTAGRADVVSVALVKREISAFSCRKLLFHSVKKISSLLKFNNGSYCYSLFTAGQTFLVWQRPACIWALVRGKNNSCRTASRELLHLLSRFPKTLFLCH